MKLTGNLVFIFFVFVTLWNCIIPGQAQQIADCAAFGVDLTPLSGQDISLNVSTPTDPGYVYVVRPCGAVSDAGCVADPTSRGSMVCQRGLSDAYGLSTWNASSVTYLRDRYGIYQQLLTGELCGANPRQSIVYYRCSASDTTPRMVSVVESPQCVYHLTIYTNLTCSLPVEAPCVFSGVNYNDMFAQGDLSITSGGFNWFLHMCASSVSNSACEQDSTANTSMICQQRADLSDAFGIARFNESTIEWQVVPTGLNAGMLFVVPDGEYCAAAGANRIARIQMVCDTTLGPEASYIHGVAETQTCQYQFTVRTSLVCSILPLTSSSTGISLSSSWWPITSLCNYNGANFFPLMAGSDLHWGGFLNNVYYDFYYHMCSIISNTQCLNDSSTYNSMFCQASITNSQDNYALDYNLPNQWVWTNTTYGMSYTSHLGERCGTVRRATTVNFVCDTGYSRIESVTLDPVSQCDITVTIFTPVVCKADGSNMPPGSNDCVYNGWDFRSLTSPTTDIQGNFTDGSTSYTISLHMCGEIESTYCERDPTATASMICQTRTVDHESYSLAEYVPGQQSWREYTADRVIQMTVGSGEMCGANPRVSIVNFTCNASYSTTTMISFTESPTCTYHLVVVANSIVCAYFNGSNWNVTSSSSTGNNGGTVGQTVLPSSCVTSDNAPDGSALFGLVLNAPFSTLISSPQSITITYLQTLNAVAGALNISAAFIQCGPLTSGGLPSSPIPSVTLLTFYFLSSPTTNPASLSAELVVIIQRDPGAINSRLPPTAPTIVPGQSLSVNCPSGQFPSASGTCQGRSSSSSSLSSGAIAGIVIGCVVGVLLLIAICFFLFGYRRNDKRYFNTTEGKKGIEMQDHSEDAEHGETEDDTM